MSYILAHWPLWFICAAMIAAAVIDGWKLKVPNWLTFPIILSGWALGLTHDLGWLPESTGAGGFGAALAGTFLGMGLLLPLYVIGGVGGGDVKMQMGFGAWAGAFFGTGGTTEAAGMHPLHGLGVVFWAFVFGAIVGGLFGLCMILIRRQFGANASMVREIGRDLKLFATGNVGVASQRASDRRQVWVKLPYGIPLCVGFLLYLGYMLVLKA